MKKYLFLLITVMLNLSAFAQGSLSTKKTQADYERVFKRFMNFYNSNQADSINNLFSKYKDWSTVRISESLEEY